MTNPPTLIIAEAGVNHCGSLDKALQLVDCAAKCGADIVKFQTFKAENLVTRSAKKANYQERTTGANETQFEMLKSLELSFDDFRRIKDHCGKRRIEFLSTAFDEECLDFLISQLEIQRIKVPSGELTNAPLLRSFGRSGLPVILSTGMSDVTEVEASLDVICHGRFFGGDSTREMKGSFKSSGCHNEWLSILHCTTDYPAKSEELNLNAMRTLGDNFSVPFGLSDHSAGVLASVVAVAMGATIVEKHFTLSKSLPGPDHKASLDPSELADMIGKIRQTEIMKGNGFKAPTETEIDNAKIARKSLAARVRIGTGEVFTQDNLTTKRPGTGLSAMKYFDLLGQKAARDYAPDDLIAEDI